MIWDVMKWVWNSATDPASLGGKFENASEYIKSAKLYLLTEYEKAYAKQSPPFQTIKALRSMGGSVGKLIYNNITEALSQKYQSLGCLSSEAKSAAVCEFIGSIAVPPTGLLSVLKYGPKALKLFPGIEKAATKLEADLGKGAKNLKISDSVAPAPLSQSLRLDNSLQLSPGNMIPVPRGPKGPGSVGTVTKIEGDVATVEFRNGPGQIETLQFSKDELNNYVSRKTPASIKSQTQPLPKIVEDKGIAPKFEIPLSNGAQIKVGEFFKDPSGYVFTIAEVEVNGSRSRQLYYLSNSQGVFRNLPARNKVVGMPGFDKAGGEDLLTASPEMQAFLLKQLKETKGKTLPTVGIDDLGGIVRKNQSPADLVAYKNSPDYIDERTVKINHIVDSGNRDLSDGVGRSFSRPENVIVSDPKLNPNYKNPVMTYEAELPLHGSVKAYVYPSKDGSLQYTLYRDSQNRVWVGDVGHANSPLTQQGVRSRAVNADELTIPLYEYPRQIPEGFAGKVNSANPKYSDTFEYISRIPLIKDWYKEMGVQIPK